MLIKAVCKAVCPSDTRWLDQLVFILLSFIYFDLKRKACWTWLCTTSPLQVRASGIVLFWAPSIFSV